MLNASRLALGTLTAFPVRAPSHVDQRVAGRAALLAPLAALPLAFAVGFTVWASYWLRIPHAATGLLCVVVLVLGTRAFHVDGLADTADGLTASYDRERSLAVMKTGDVGPAGVAAVVLVLGLQAVGFASLWGTPGLAALAVVLSRAVLPLCCLVGIPAARNEGLGNPFAGSVRWLPAMIVWLAAMGLTAAAFNARHESWVGVLVAAGMATLLVGLLLRRAVRRLGGVTGDIFGAAIELTLATIVVLA